MARLVNDGKRHTVGKLDGGDGAEHYQLAGNGQETPPSAELTITM